MINKLKLVNCTPKYFSFMKSLRNENSIRAKMTHIDLNYYNKDYMEKNCKFFNVCLLDKKPVGFINLRHGSIGIVVDPKYQRKGIGTFMLNALNDFNREEKFAKVKIDNKVSLNFFKKCGYKKKYYILEKKIEDKKK